MGMNNFSALRKTARSQDRRSGSVAIIAHSRLPLHMSMTTRAPSRASFKPSKGPQRTARVGAAHVSSQPHRPHDPRGIQTMQTRRKGWGPDADMRGKSTVLRGAKHPAQSRKGSDDAGEIMPVTFNTKTNCLTPQCPQARNICAPDHVQKLSTLCGGN